MASDDNYYSTLRSKLEPDIFDRRGYYKEYSLFRSLFDGADAYYRCALFILNRDHYLLKEYLRKHPNKTVKDYYASKSYRDFNGRIQKILREDDAKRKLAEYLNNLFIPINLLDLVLRFYYHFNIDKARYDLIRREMEEYRNRGLMFILNSLYAEYINNYWNLDYPYSFISKPVVKAREEVTDDIYFLDWDEYSHPNVPFFVSIADCLDNLEDTARFMSISYETHLATRLAVRIIHREMDIMASNLIIQKQPIFPYLQYILAMVVIEETEIDQFFKCYQHLMRSEFKLIQEIKYSRYQLTYNSKVIGEYFFHLVDSLYRKQSITIDDYLIFLLRSYFILHNGDTIMLDSADELYFAELFYSSTISKSSILNIKYQTYVSDLFTFFPHLEQRYLVNPSQFISDTIDPRYRCYSLLNEIRLNIPKVLNIAPHLISTLANKRIFAVYKNKFSILLYLIALELKLSNAILVNHSEVEELVEGELYVESSMLNMIITIPPDLEISNYVSINRELPSILLSELLLKIIKVTEKIFRDCEKKELSLIKHITDIYDFVSIPEGIVGKGITKDLEIYKIAIVL